MASFVIEGGHRLKGVIEPQGAKMRRSKLLRPLCSLQSLCALLTYLIY